MTPAERAHICAVLTKTGKLADSLTSALERLRDHAPLTSAFVGGATEADKDLMDAFVHRYCKLQDMLGNQVFRSILIADLETPPAAMVDVVNAVAKRGVVDDLTEWDVLRKMRNRLVHEYEDAPERAARALQDAIATAAPLMLDIHARAVKYLMARLTEREG